MGDRTPLQTVAAWSAALGALLLLIIGLPSAAAGTNSNWSAYLFNARHSSVSLGATTITRSNAATLTRVWQWVPDAPTMLGQPAAQLVSSPIVFGGHIYIGANTGVLYDLDETTGSVLWRRFIGFAPAKTCGARGFASTATVARDPITHILTVYVAGADGVLYALDAANGSTVWSTPVVSPSSTENDYFVWSSPTVANGLIDVGISSQCDHPLVRGGLAAFDQVTGNELATYFTVPDGSVGGSIWSSPAATSDGYVWVTTGNQDPNSPSAGDSDSVVRLQGTSLAKRGTWTVPVADQTLDGDFGASPTIFKAIVGGKTVRMVGACNKNGVFYALRADRLGAGPVWHLQIGEAPTSTSTNDHCQAGALWDGSRLIVAGNTTTIEGSTYGGSVRSVDPSTGAVRWETGLSAQVLGTPTEDGAGVVAVATWSVTGAPNAAYLLNADTGDVLATLATGGSKTFAQPVFAGQYLLLATLDQGLMAYRPS